VHTPAGSHTLCTLWSEVRLSAHWGVKSDSLHTAEWSQTLCTMRSEVIHSVHCGVKSDTLHTAEWSQTLCTLRSEVRHSAHSGVKPNTPQWSYTLPQSETKHFKLLRRDSGSVVKTFDVWCFKDWSLILGAGNNNVLVTRSVWSTLVSSVCYASFVHASTWSGLKAGYQKLCRVYNTTRLSQGNSKGTIYTLTNNT